MERLSVAVSGAVQFGRDLIVHQFPSAAFDSTEGRAGSVVGESLRPESAPVVGSNLVQRVHHIVKGVRLHHGRTARSSIKCFAEIVERFLALALLTDDDI